MTPVEFETLARTDLDTQIVSRIRGEILSGAYVPGDLLAPERELASQFGVNRTTVREALSRLEHLGLVERRQGVGCRVLDYRHTASVDLLPHLLEGVDSAGFDLEAVRSLVEFGTVYWSFVGRLATERATTQDLERLAVDLDGAERAFEVADQSIAEAALRRFYSGIVTATHSIVLELQRNTFMKILDASGNAGGSIFADLAARAISDAESRTLPRDIYEALVARNADAAELATRRALRELEFVIIQAGATGRQGND